MKYLLIGIILGAAALLVLFWFSSRVPDGLGVEDGRLADCPDRDNCVCSQATDKAHRIAPMAAHGPTEEVMTGLARAIESMAGGAVVELDGPYLRAVFTSHLWRFKDDVECLYDEQGGVVQVRSASRIGYSDLGANRRRMEALRQLMAGQ